MAQQTFSSGDFDRYAKSTKRQVFLEQMDQIIPWSELIALVKPHYPNAVNGRPFIPLEKMLRIHFLQHWFALSDPAAEETIHDSRSMRIFARIDLGKESALDETTICRFCHLLEKNDIGPQMMKIVNAYLARNGFRVSTGTIVDATTPPNVRDSQKLPELLHGKKI